MNVGIISSREHIKFAQIMLLSLVENCSEFIDLYLFHTDLKETEYNVLAVDKAKIKVHAIKVDVLLFDGIKVKGHFGLYSYFRLLAPYILPKELERILWLDTDLIICKDLAEYYYSDFHQACLVASPSYMSIGGGGLCRELIDKYCVGEDYTYFNAGVLIMNLPEMRKTNSLEAILKMVYDDMLLLEYIDQDVLNILYWNRCKLTSQYLYNFAPKDACVDRNINAKSIENAYIIHYCGALKPSDGRYRELGFSQFWKYAKRIDYKAYLRASAWHAFYVVGRNIKGLTKGKKRKNKYNEW